MHKTIMASLACLAAAAIAQPASANPLAGSVSVNSRSSSMELVGHRKGQGHHHHKKKKKIHIHLGDGGHGHNKGHGHGHKKKKHHDH